MDRMKDVRPRISWNEDAWGTGGGDVFQPQMNADGQKDVADERGWFLEEGLGWMGWWGFFNREWTRMDANGGEEVCCS
jgi:hypothetical protein